MFKKKSIVVVAAALWSAPTMAAEPALNAGNAAGLYTSLKDMGYAPTPIEIKPDIASTVITSNGSQYWLVLGGCTDKKGCSYIVVGSSFTDVVEPPTAWLLDQNKDLDLIKVWLNDDKLLTYSASVLTADLTRTQFRAFVDTLIVSEVLLGQRAIEAKLVK